MGYTFYMSNENPLPSPERQIASDPEKQKSIEASRSFKQLYETLRTIGSIESTTGPFEAEELISIIEKVRTGQRELTYVTRTHGLREKVKSLMSEEVKGPKNPAPSEAAVALELPLPEEEAKVEKNIEEVGPNKPPSSETAAAKELPLSESVEELEEEGETGEPEPPSAEEWVILNEWNPKLEVWGEPKLDLPPKTLERWETIKPLYLAAKAKYERYLARNSSNLNAGMQEKNGSVASAAEFAKRKEDDKVRLQKLRKRLKLRQRQLPS